MITAVGMMIGVSVFGGQAWDLWHILALMAADIIAYTLARR